MPESFAVSRGAELLHQLFGFHSFAEFNTYVTFVFLGMSIMMVTSAITSAPVFVSDYYIYATGVRGAKPEAPLFWKNSMTFYYAGTYAMQLLVEFLSLTPFMRRIPLTVRLFVGLCVPFLELLLIIVVPAATIPTQSGAIAVLMVVSVMSGFSKALCDSCTNALVGPFPTKFMNGAQWGLTIVALFMSVVQVILKAAMGTTFEDVVLQSRIYFGFGLAIQAIAIVEMILLRRNPFAQKYVAEFRAAAGRAGEADVCPASSPANPMCSHSLVEPASCDAAELVSDAKHRVGALWEEDDDTRALHKLVPEGGTVLQATGDADKMVDLDQTGNITSSQQMLQVSVMSVVKRVYPMLFCTFLVFFTSLLTFPGLFFQVDEDGWYQTIVVLLFNAGDFVSRIVLMVRFMRPSPKVVIAGSLGRLILIPLLVLCCRHIIKGHWLPYILIILIGLTNGYFGTMAVMYSPRTPLLHYAGERSIAAMLAGIFIILGLCFGSNLAVVVNLSFG